MCYRAFIALYGLTICIPEPISFYWHDLVIPIHFYDICFAGLCFEILTTGFDLLFNKLEVVNCIWSLFKFF